MSKSIKVKAIICERFDDYKLPSMMIATSRCSFKCEKESGVCCCQNSSLALSKTYTADVDDIIDEYMSDPITSAVVFGGLEPMDQFDEVFCFIETFREKYAMNDTVVIYTGYNKEEIRDQIELLKQFGNIIVKFGRFVPDEEKHFDDTLGVYLASSNQYGEKIC